MIPDPGELDAIINRALAEDAVGSDATSLSLIPPNLEATASLVTKQPGILAGIHISDAVFKRVNPDLKFVCRLQDGDRLAAGKTLATVSGSIASILSGERTALNFLQRMSGIATLTDLYVSAVEGTNASIVDTRKTVPGLRRLDKYSVHIGGGRNHRMNLSDGVLIKDNHIAALRSTGNTLEQLIKQARSTAPHTLKIEVEVESVEGAISAASAGADIVMLDNMHSDDMRSAVAQISDQCIVEASGGITLANVAEVASTGVDFISIGALTHSPMALDISLDYHTKIT